MADQNISVRASSVSLGITVVLLYAFFVSLVTFGFGSYIYRTGWQVEPITTTTTLRAEGPAQQDGTGPGAVDREVVISGDLDNLLFILKREKDLEREKSQLFVDMQVQRGKVSDLATQRQQSWASIAETKGALLAHADATLGEISRFQFELNGIARLDFESARSEMEASAAKDENSERAMNAATRVMVLLDKLMQGLQSSDVDLDTKDQFEAFHSAAIARFEPLIGEVTVANAFSHGLKGQLDVEQARLDEMIRRSNAYESDIKALQATLGPGSPARARLSALTLNQTFFPDILMRLVSFPTIFLTLIVTIAAGGLGTVVAFSRRYYSSKHAASLTLSRLFVNVGEGIAAAIAIFLFSGAGMLALTQGGGSVNSVELSPYTVAFIAFLSGFMAEDAFASIQSAGKRIFATEEENGNGATDTTLPAVIDAPDPPATTARPSS